MVYCLSLPSGICLPCHSNFSFWFENTVLETWTENVSKSLCIEQDLNHFLIQLNNGQFQDPSLQYVLLLQILVKIAVCHWLRNTWLRNTYIVA